MAIEWNLGDGISGILAKFIPQEKKGSTPPALRSISKDRELLAFYGIPNNVLNALPTTGIIEYPTRHGNLRIDCDKRAIIPPLQYYSSQNASLKIHP